MKMELQAMDRDWFSKNEIIGCSIIDLEPLIEDCSAKGKPMALTKKYYNEYLVKELKWDPIKYDNEEDFWVEVKAKDNSNNYTCNGKIRM